eukprot:scaffold51037_cov32-Phaeocystis_antarctica.AAC.1
MRVGPEIIDRQYRGGTPEVAGKMVSGMTTDVYSRENCIAPDMYRIDSMNHAHKRWMDGEMV